MKTHLLILVLLLLARVGLAQVSEIDSSKLKSSLEGQEVRSTAYTFSEGYQNKSDWGYRFNNITPCLEFFEDAANTYSLEEIATNWESLGQAYEENTSFDRKNPYWAKTSIIGSDQFQGLHLFRLGVTGGGGSWAKVTVFYSNPEGGFDLQRTGSSIPFGKRFRNHQMNLFELNVPQNDTLQVYFRLEQINHNFQWPPRSGGLFFNHIDRDDFWANQPKLLLQTGMVLGSLLLFFIYFFIHYLIEKKREYFYFSIMMLMLFLGRLNTGGMILFIPPLVEWWGVIYEIIAAVFFINLCFFTRIYLNLEELKIRSRQYLFPFLYIILITRLVYIFTYIFRSPYIDQAAQLRSFSDILFWLFLIYLGIQALRKGHRPALFYLINFALLIIMALLLGIEVLTRNNLLPLDDLLFLVNLSILVVPVLFALGMSYRAKILGQQKEAAVLAENVSAVKASLAEEANEAKSNFLSVVSHELRTPLTSIIGFSKLNRKNLTDKIIPAANSLEEKVKKATFRNQQNLGVIISEGERLTKLINELLDLAKIESGQVKWEMQEVAPATLIQRAVAATSSLIEQKQNLNLIETIAEGLPNFTADQDRLIQVLINLISNAVKFTDHGTIEIQVVQTTTQELTFSVKDTGTGIPKDSLSLVFERFKQVDDQQTGRPQGTGLGLPICKEIVEHHGGRIWVESEINAGSTFAFTIPIP